MTDKQMPTRGALVAVREGHTTAVYRSGDEIEKDGFLAAFYVPDNGTDADREANARKFLHADALVEALKLAEDAMSDVDIAESSMSASYARRFREAQEKARAILAKIGGVNEPT